MLGYFHYLYNIYINHSIFITQKAIAELREKLKLQAPVNKMVDEIKEVQPWELKPDTDYWPDPFDNKKEYIEIHKADNKPVPLAVGGAA